ncbi:MAG: hypothetical protein JRD68_16725 [Deltaproteobacteria bacterium]|nr:hypothetical protein [Deltaproteobacteria bacterium]
MTLQARITGRIKIPNLDLSNELLEIGNKDVIGRLAKNIQKGIDLKEKKYPPLAASTIKAKGHGRPLIKTGKLHSSFKAKKRGKNKVLISINAARREIAKFLQIDGIRTKRGKKRFNFFGVSTRMEVSATKRMEGWIRKRIRDAGR